MKGVLYCCLSQAETTTTRTMQGINSHAWHNKHNGAGFCFLPFFLPVFLFFYFLSYFFYYFFILALSVAPFAFGFICFSSRGLLTCRQASMSPWGAIHVRKWRILVALPLPLSLQQGQDQDQGESGSGCSTVARPTNSQLVRDLLGTQRLSLLG